MRGRESVECAGYLLAGLFAAAAPSLGRYGGLPFAVLAVGDVASRSRLAPWHYRQRSRRLLAFAVTAAVLAVLLPAIGVRSFVVAAAVVLAVVGHLATRRRRSAVAAGLGYLVVGGGAAVGVGALVAPGLFDSVAVTATTGAVAAATLRAVLDRARPTAVLLGVAAAMSVGAAFAGNVTALDVATALLVTGSLGGFAYTAGTMTASGAFGGVLLSFVTIVAAGYRWFLLLGLFVVLGAAWTRYRQEEKVALGVADIGEKRRGFSNVMANGAVALVAAAWWGVSPDAGLAAPLAFAGSIATATGDTLSSEIGSVHGTPRLITTMEHVPPGTDGGVSPVGELVTLVGALAIGVVAAGLGVVDVGHVGVVAVGGVVGSHVDSLLGATVEGRAIGNDGVNLSACAAGAAATVLLAPVLAV